MADLTGQRESAPAAPEALRQPSVTRLVREAIECMVLDGAIKPGQHVSEAMLASHLGVSRGPIREACRGLVENGLLVYEANRGCFVKQLSLREVVDVYDVRASLARLVGRTLATRLNREQFHHLADLVSQMDKANQAWDFEKFYDLNLDFHDRMIEYTGNQKLQVIHGSLVKELHIFRRRGLIEGENTVLSNDEHRAIIEALKLRDVENSGAQMEQHVLSGKMRFLEAFGRHVK